MAESQENMRIRVICPVCQKSEYIEVPASNLKRSGKGLTTILIPDATVCEHSFQIFVDKNGAVRGYETPDFELKFTPSEEDTVKEDLGDKNNLQIAKTMFGNEIFYKCIRTGLTNGSIFCITEHEYIKNNFSSFFSKIFGKYSPEVKVANLEDYNTSLRQKIYSSAYKNAFVFNADLTAIIKQRFKERLIRPEKYEFEQEILKKVDVNKSKDDKIVKTLQSTFEKIIEAAEKVKGEIESKKIKNKKDTENQFKKNSKISAKFELIDEILKYRFDFDAEKIFFNVNAKVQKLNSLF